jgi:2-polyprenyl-6-methoxyphenol hydroxylase-like FAD-dependent oxidoreductase
MLAIERDRWLVTLGGYLGERAPNELGAYLEFAASLPCPDIYDVVRRAQPLTDPVHITFRASRRHRYEDMRSFPQRYLVLGDALCSFNPVYGQGMSVAVLEALELEACLSDPRPLVDIGRRMARSTAKIIERAWRLAVSGDLAFPEVIGQRPFGHASIDWCLRRLHEAAATDRVVCRTFFDVANLERSPLAFARPGIVTRTLRARLLRARAAGS